MSIQGVPKGLRRQVLAAVVAVLKAHPLLANKRVIKTWLLWDGTQTPVGPPETGSMPALQVRMIGGGVGRIAGARRVGGPMRNVDVSTPTILLDLWTAGTDQGDLADVAELVYEAMNPQDPPARAFLQEKFREAGIKDWQLTREILPSNPGSFADTHIEGNGSYQLTIHIIA